MSCNGQRQSQISRTFKHGIAVIQRDIDRRADDNRHRHNRNRQDGNNAKHAHIRFNNHICLTCKHLIFKQDRRQDAGSDENKIDNSITAPFMNQFIF